MNPQNNEWRDLTEEEEKEFRVRYTPLGRQVWQTRRPLPTQPLTTQETTQYEIYRLKAMVLEAAQQRKKKLKEAERLEADVTDLMLQADKLSRKAEKLREEAGQ